VIHKTTHNPVTCDSCVTWRWFLWNKSCCQQ